MSCWLFEMIQNMKKTKYVNVLSFLYTHVLYIYSAFDSITNCQIVSPTLLKLNKMLNFVGSDCAGAGLTGVFFGVCSLSFEH